VYGSFRRLTCAQRKEGLQKEYAGKMAQAANAEAKAALKKEFDQRQKELDAAFASSIDLLLDSYDKHASLFSPPPLRQVIFDIRRRISVYDFDASRLTRRAGI
jgi:hypothetical protein